MTGWRIRYRDLRVTDTERRQALRAAFERCLDHGMFIMGREVESFETCVADYCGTRYCVGVASGTSALYLALRAFGVGRGDDVICPPLSWIATLNAIRACGASPVFVDIGDDLNIDAARIESAVTPRTKAIVPVHFTGRICDMEAIRASADRHDLLVIEDAAQAFGAELNQQKAGSFCDAGAFSLNPMKLFSGYGEAGAVTVDDAIVSERLRSLRYLGTVDGESCVDPELNHKIDALQAALLTDTLPFVSEFVRRRHVLAARYCDRLSTLVQCPESPDVQGLRSVFFDFTIQTDARDGLVEHLERRGIEVKIRHPVAMPDHPAYEYLPAADIPKARAAVARIVSLPIHEKLELADVDYVCDAVEAFFRDAGA